MFSELVELEEYGSILSRLESHRAPLVIFSLSAPRSCKKKVANIKKRTLAVFRLYAYVYRDLTIVCFSFDAYFTHVFAYIQWTGTKRGQRYAQTLVFFLSAAFHEYWFGVSLRIFYPIIFNIYFICGGIFFVISRLVTSPRIWNIMM